MTRKITLALRGPWLVVTGSKDANDVLRVLGYRWNGRAWVKRLAEFSTAATELAEARTALASALATVPA